MVREIFLFPTRPPSGAATQSTSKPPSRFGSQQTEESYPDLGSMKRELERAQRERDKAILDRDQATLERDQAKLDRGQAKLEHMNEGLEAWTTPEPVPSLRNLEANPVRPLMEISLPGLTTKSTSSSQTETGTSRLRELQERLQSRAREN